MGYHTTEMLLQSVGRVADIQGAPHICKYSALVTNLFDRLTDPVSFSEQSKKLAQARGDVKT